MEAPELRALLVEDDAKLARLTCDYLEQNGVRVSWVAEGRSALESARSAEFDVIVLDLMLPDIDGFDVCREIRAHSSVPIIAVTARVEVEDRVRGLDLGADDYLTKPYSARELLARIHALSRRLAKDRPGTTIRAGRISVDTGNYSVTLDGEPLALTSYEFMLLRALAENVGRVLTREQLLELTKGSTEDVFGRSIDVRISRLRQKLGDDSRQPRLLKTIRGTGYVLSAESRP